VADGKADERIVTLGERIGGDVEITSGLSREDRVVAEPQGRVTDGMPVRAR
jgi:multidrug efflux pump subunit AcrA (membrane-fusion protein)